MPEAKAKPIDPAVEAFLAGVTDPVRKADCVALIDAMRKSTKCPPRMWGSIVGFGDRHYRYASGREGDTFVLGYAARKTDFTLYLGPDLAALGEVGAEVEVQDRTRAASTSARSPMSIRRHCVNCSRPEQCGMHNRHNRIDQLFGRRQPGTPLAPLLASGTTPTRYPFTPVWQCCAAGKVDPNSCRPLIRDNPDAIGEKPQF